MRSQVWGGKCGWRLALTRSGLREATGEAPSEGGEGGLKAREARESLRAPGSGLRPAVDAQPYPVAVARTLPQAYCGFTSDLLGL